MTDEKVNYWGIFVQNQSVLPSLILVLLYRRTCCYSPDFDPAGDEFGRAATAFKVAGKYDDAKVLIGQG